MKEKIKLQTLSTIIILLFMTTAMLLIKNSGVIGFLSDEDMRAEKEKIIRTAKENEYTMGDIIDHDGNIICHTDKESDTRYCSLGEAVGNLVGFANDAGDSIGLEEMYHSELAYDKSDKEGKYGKTMRLSINSKLQSVLYNAMKGYSGGAVVLEVDTGRIMAMVSTPSFDPTNIKENYAEIAKQGGVFFNKAYRSNIAPGSVFKLVTSIGILENKLDKEKVNDNGEIEVDGTVIRNAGHNAYGKIGYYDALTHSSNVYFVTKALELGTANMQNILDRCLIGKEIVTDLSDTPLKSTGVYTSWTQKELAYSAFGQGNITVTPLHMAAIVQGIANYGDMKYPWIVEGIYDSKGETSYSCQDRMRTISKLTNKSVCKKILTAMERNWKSYSFDAPNPLEIGAKTGTAEVLENGLMKYNAWMAAVMPVSSPKYVIVAVDIGGNYSGIQMRPIIEAAAGCLSVLDEENK